jgi:uncharacterized membrane protein YedE/YeeE
MLLSFFFGIIFGIVIIYAKLTRFDTIVGFVKLTDMTVPKALLTSMGVGMILLMVLTKTGLAVYHIKPFLTGGLIVGGLLFGVGMAVLGYCPGTLFISAGEGSVDAFMGIVGGLLGGVGFTLAYPYISGFLGPDLGTLSLSNILNAPPFVVAGLTVVIGVTFLLLAFNLNKKEGATDKRWLIAGLALAVLNSVVLLKIASNRPIGASTTYPFVGDLLFGLTDTAYFRKIIKPGHWEMVFLSGAFFVSVVMTFLRKEANFYFLPRLWKEYKGTVVVKRIAWSFVGGFILIFGARLAGGCTSGHILSGGMQLAFSSYFFAFFVIIGLVITGKVFYKKSV